MGAIAVSSTEGGREMSSRGRTRFAKWTLLWVMAAAVVVAVPSSNASHLGYVHLGHSNSSAAETSINNLDRASPSNTALYLFGARALYAVGDPGHGVRAFSYGTDAVSAAAVNEGNGVLGTTRDAGRSGVRGENSGSGYGVTGDSQSGTGVRGRGVGNGVEGESSGWGSGVYGLHTGVGGWGVAGRNNQTNGVGTVGEAMGAGGIGVRAVAGSSGTALRVEGKAVFDRSGKATIDGTPANPKSSVRVVVAGAPLTAASVVLATLQTRKGGIAVAAAEANQAGTAFTIYLTKSVSSTAIVGWMIVN